MRYLLILIILSDALLLALICASLYTTSWWKVDYEDFNTTSTISPTTTEYNKYINGHEGMGVFRNTLCIDGKKCKDVLKDNRESFEKAAGLLGILAVVVSSLFLVWCITIAFCMRTQSTIKLLILCPIVTFIFLFATVTVYGIMAKEKWEKLIDREHVTSSGFGYSYWIMVAALLVDFVLLILVIANSFLPSRDAIVPTHTEAFKDHEGS